MRVRTFGQMALLVLLGACSSLVPKLQAPTLDVVGVELLRGDLFEQQLRVRIKVTNPNDRMLPVNSIRYKMELAGEAFADGESEREFQVPALGTTEFDVTVRANAASVLLRLLGGGRKPDSVDYRLTGQVKLASGLLRTIPFEEKGAIDLR